MNHTNLHTDTVTSALQTALQTALQQYEQEPDLSKQTTILLNALNLGVQNLKTTFHNIRKEATIQLEQKEKEDSEKYIENQLINS